MIEPTESESVAELERFIEAMFCIYDEIEEVATGKYDRNNNVLKNAPHTAEMIASDNWTFPYPRSKAAFPLPWVRENKFWPYASRINDAYGDRNLICSCSGFTF
jgi:glycine dehydrogenase